MAGKIEKITAKAGKSTYHIYIGKEILPTIAALDEVKGADKIALIVSSHVYELHDQYIEEFRRALPSGELFLMADGEENKNYRYAEMFLENFLEKGINRKSLVIGIGGGVVGDFAGFISSIYMRGIGVIHVPTTLLAMVDSSIGGKTGVNLSLGKNIAGTFYQPRMVVSDIGFLHTLDDRELKNGLVEALKHGLIGDRRTIRIFEENNIDSIRNDNVITELISLSASFKSSVVESDVKETGARAILNFGHTIGHAIESLMEYKSISHGEAVAIGMIIKLGISKRLSWLTNDEVKRIEKIINAFSLIRDDLTFKVEDVIEHMQYDKKNSGGKINFILLKGIGNPLINQQIDDKLLYEIMNEILE